VGQEVTFPELLETMVRFKAIRAKVDGMEVELSPEAFRPGAVAELAPQTEAVKQRIPTAEEVLFWSAGAGAEPEPEDAST
jgi:hypothetical protein